MGILSCTGRRLALALPAADLFGGFAGRHGTLELGFEAVLLDDWFSFQISCFTGNFASAFKIGSCGFSFLEFSGAVSGKPRFDKQSAQSARVFPDLE